MGPVGSRRGSTGFATFDNLTQALLSDTGLGAAAHDLNIVPVSSD